MSVSGRHSLCLCGPGDGLGACRQITPCWRHIVQVVVNITPLCRYFAHICRMANSYVQAGENISRYVTVHLTMGDLIHDCCVACFD